MAAEPDRHHILITWLRSPIVTIHHHMVAEPDRHGIPKDRHLRPALPAIVAPLHTIFHLRGILQAGPSEDPWQSRQVRHCPKSGRRPLPLKKHPWLREQRFENPGCFGCLNPGFQTLLSYPLLPTHLFFPEPRHQFPFLDFIIRTRNWGKSGKRYSP